MRFSDPDAAQIARQMELCHKYGEDLGHNRKLNNNPEAGIFFGLMKGAKDDIEASMRASVVERESEFLADIGSEIKHFKDDYMKEYQADSLNGTMNSNGERVQKVPSNAQNEKASVEALIKRNEADMMKLYKMIETKNASSKETHAAVAKGCKHVMNYNGVVITTSDPISEANAKARAEERQQKKLQRPATAAPLRDFAREHREAEAAKQAAQTQQGQGQASASSSAHAQPRGSRTLPGRAVRSQPVSRPPSAAPRRPPSAARERPATAYQREVIATEMPPHLKQPKTSPYLQGQPRQQPSSARMRPQSAKAVLADFQHIINTARDPERNFAMDLSEIREVPDSEAGLDAKKIYAFASTHDDWLKNVLSPRSVTLSQMLSPKESDIGGVAASLNQPQQPRQQFVQAGPGMQNITLPPAGSPPPASSPGTSNDDMPRAPAASKASGGFEILDYSAIKKEDEKKVLYNKRAYGHSSFDEDTEEFMIKKRLASLAQQASAHTRFMRKQEAREAKMR